MVGSVDSLNSGFHVGVASSTVLDPGVRGAVELSGDAIVLVMLAFWHSQKQNQWVDELKAKAQRHCSSIFARMVVPICLISIVAE